METLRFKVKGQIMKKDSYAPSARMVAGTANYYCAEFLMDSVWNGFACLAEFTAGDSSVAIPITMQSGVGYGVMIPEDILANRLFSVRVIGQKDDTRLVTNSVKIYQSGGENK